MFVIWYSIVNCKECYNAWFRRAGMMLYPIGMVILTTLIIGAIYQRASTLINDYRYPPLGKLIDIGPCKLHIQVSGQGGPTVVLDAGMGGTSLSWALVQSELSKHTQVCSYDRVGYGWSEEASSQRTSQSIIKELHTLLHNARIPGPYILVGHSFGGCNMLLFAHQYPEETAGVVLVDSVHEDMVEELPLNASKGLLTKIWQHPHLQWFISFVGYHRLRGLSKEIEKMFHPLPENIKAMYISHLSRTSYTKTVLREMSDINESLSQLKMPMFSLVISPSLSSQQASYPRMNRATYGKDYKTNCY